MENVPKHDVHTYTSVLFWKYSWFSRKGYLAHLRGRKYFFTINILFTIRVLSVRVAIIAHTARPQTITAFKCSQRKRNADRSVAELPYLWPLGSSHMISRSLKHVIFSISISLFMSDPKIRISKRSQRTEFLNNSSVVSILIDFLPSLFFTYYMWHFHPLNISYP